MAYFNFESKRVYYTIQGEGKPLLLLHGDATSSRLFDPVIGLYKQQYKVILIDFPGNGKSERLSRFETNFYFYYSRVCYGLLEELQLEKTAVIGTSGGAIVGMNLALEHPESVSCLIADSFEGERPLASYAGILDSDREQSKRSLGGKLFYWWNHGFDWKKVVDANTKALTELYRSGKSYYRTPIESLAVPTMLTGSKEDEFCNTLERIYQDMKKKNDHLQIHLFEKGGHPAMLSNKKEFFTLVTNTIN